MKLSPDVFVSPPEKEILALMTSTFLRGMKIMKSNESYHNSFFFIYDRSNIIKQTFVSEIKKFLSLMCSSGYFGKTQKIKRAHLIPSKNSQSFFIEKDSIREFLTLQVKHVSRTELITTDKKVHELLFSKINKFKRNMKILDFVIIRGQQVFEEGKDINPIEIKLEDNRLQNIFDKYNTIKIRFRPIGILISSSIVNDTEKIYLQTTGLYIC